MVTDHGQFAGTGSLAAGAIAADCEARLWSLDEDFGRMARLKLVDIDTSP